MRVNSVDIGAVGDTPPVFAQAAHGDLLYIAAQRSGGQAILGVAGLLIEQMLHDLKGRKVAFGCASSAHNLTLAALEGRLHLRRHPADLSAPPTPALDHGRPCGCPSLPFDVGPPPDSLVGAGDLAAFHQRWPSGAGGRARAGRRSLWRAGGRGVVRPPAAVAAVVHLFHQRRTAAVDAAAHHAGGAGAGRPGAGGRRRLSLFAALAVSVHATRGPGLQQLVATPLHYLGESLTSPTSLAVLFRGFGDGTLAGAPCSARSTCSACGGCGCSPWAWPPRPAGRRGDTSGGCWPSM